ncbi:hypothetical protein CGZ92_12500 [Parenemella sanctibonifatiensis]|uniref:Uncharacterized protein n=2 Tax=Parenemella sanctibonifatiensis TaxID=2016505 RepID=A0A255DZH4_9ACTN|nr:hypothetical protein CGZ92_12500 [Parenemella sanctibonifatiensis]
MADMAEGEARLPSLRAIADQLYALDPRDFTSQRDAWVKQAKAVKDRDLGQRISKLRRPTVAAGHLNRAVRAQLPLLMQFLELAEPMRAAHQTLSVAELAGFSAQRKQLEAQAVREVADLVREQGASPSQATLDEIHATLGAALADPDAEAALRSGTLARSLSYAGFGRVDLENALAADPELLPVEPADRTPEPSDRPKLRVAGPEDQEAAADRAARERAEAQAKEERAKEQARLEAERRQAMRDRAERMLAGLVRSRDRAQTAHERVAERAERARARRDDLTERLRAAEDELVAVEQELAEAAGDLSQVEADVADQQALIADLD